MAEDYYKVLGISRDANAAEVKRAFYKLALQFHPDRHARASDQSRLAAGQRFKELSEAYEVLSNAKKRAIYNREGPPHGRRSSSSSYESHARAASWRQEPFHSSNFYPQGRSTRRWFRWSFPSFGFSRADYGFQGLILVVAVLGFTFADSAFDSFWKVRNSGKSFEEAMEAVDREKQSKVDREEKAQ